MSIQNRIPSFLGFILLFLKQMKNLFAFSIFLKPSKLEQLRIHRTYFSTSYKPKAIFININVNVTYLRTFIKGNTLGLWRLKTEKEKPPPKGAQSTI